VSIQILKIKLKLNIGYLLTENAINMTLT